MSDPRHATLRCAWDVSSLNIKSVLTVAYQHRFRWVKCQIDDLCEQRTGKDIRNALKQTPKDLQTTYLTTWNTIPIADKRIAKSALAFLAGVLCPLQLKEVAEASIIQDGMDSLDNDSLLCRPEDILDICGNLVFYDKNNYEITLAHSSVQTFLVSSGHAVKDYNSHRMGEQSIHQLIAENCLTYLCFKDFQKGPCDVANIPLRKQRWPLLDYASNYWPMHLNKLDLSDPINASVLDLVQRFFATCSDENGGCFTAWVQNIGPQMAIAKILKGTPLYYACFFGLTQLVEMNVAERWSQQIDQRCGYHKATPLFIAAYWGHTQCVKALLEAGADPLAMNGFGETPLDWAIIKRHHDIKAILDEYSAYERWPASEPSLYKVLVEMKRAKMTSEAIPRGLEQEI